MTARTRGRAGELPALDDLRTWHRQSLEGVRLAQANVAGGLRGEGPAGGLLATCQNGVGVVPGAPPGEVARLVAEFFIELHARAAALDARRTPEVEDPDDVYDDAVELAAWAHGEWVRIHPFVNNNGSTARVLAIMIGAHFDLALALPGKPRSDALTARRADGSDLTYDTAAKAQMYGSDVLMIEYLYDVIM